MSQGYFWVASSLEAVTLFAIGPLLGIAIAYRAWRRRMEPCSARQNRTRCILSGVSAILLFLIAKWMNADIKTALYLVQLACVLAGGLLFNACMGYFVSVILSIAYWHNRTRLK